MILRGIQVEGWACFSNRIDVGPFDERINVLYGPNGAGKSTLSKILTRGLVENHGVGGAEAQSLRPWGRALTPKVTIEFAHGGAEYRLRKRFLDKPSALLERREAASWVRIAEDDAADEHTRELLRADAPGAGLTNSKHWVMMQVLWSPQDQQYLPSLSGDVLSDIRRSLGVHVVTPLGQDLADRVEQAYLQVFTPTGRLRSGVNEASLIRLKREHAAAAAAVQRTQEELRTLELRRGHINELRARYETFRDASEGISTELERAQKLLGEYQQLVAQKTEREQRRRAAQSEHIRIKQQLETIQECAKVIFRAEEELKLIDNELPRTSEVFESKDRDYKLAEAAMDQALANQTTAWGTAELATMARRFTDLRQLRSNLESALQEVRQATADVDRLQDSLNSFRAPTKEQLADIRKQIRARDEAQVRLESSLIALELEPVTDASMVVISGDQTGPMHVPGGHSTRVAGSPAVEIEIVGFGRVRATGPAGSVAQYRKQFQQALARIDQLVVPFGTNDEIRLEELTAQGEGLRAELQSSRSRRDGLLHGKTINELNLERMQIIAEIDQILEKQPFWLDAPPDVKVIEEEARRAQKDSDAGVRHAQEVLTSAQSALSTVTAERLDLQKRQGRCKTQIEDESRQLAALKADGKSEEERRKELNDAALEWDAQRAAIEKLDQALAAYAENPEDRVLSLESKCSRATKERDLARDQVARRRSRGARGVLVCSLFSASGSQRRRGSSQGCAGQ